MVLKMPKFRLHTKPKIKIV